MEVIAHGLEIGHPFAYFLIFMLLYPPVFAIIFAVIDWIRNKRK